MKIPRNVAEFRRWLQAEIAELGTFLETDPEENQFEDAAIAVKNARRLAIALELPAIAKLCDITTRAYSVTKARQILTECVAALDADDALTVQQAAERLLVSVRTIYSLVRSGRLHAQRLGSGRGTIRIAPADLANIGPTRKLRHL
jgi:excisionase family DNA binding protein